MFGGEETHHFLKISIGNKGKHAKAVVTIHNIRPLLKDTLFPVTPAQYASNLVKCAAAGAGIECNIL